MLRFLHRFLLLRLKHLRILKKDRSLLALSKYETSYGCAESTEPEVYVKILRSVWFNFPDDKKIQTVSNETLV